MAESEEALFKKQLKELGSFRGNNTELISLYMPPDTDRSAVMTQLSNEVSQSSNIKDQKTRKNVQAALRRIMNFLKQIDFDIPEKGLVLFSGNISSNPSKIDIQLFAVNPLKKLAVKLYWCDSEFHLVPLKEMIEPGKLYGIIAIDKHEATLAVIKGKSYEIIGHFTSNVPGKIRAGGQSAQRFERLREEAEHDFYKKVSEKANAAFTAVLEKLEVIIVSGPGMTKNDFVETDLLDYRLKKKVLGTIDTGYADEHGIKETINRATDLLKNAEITKEKNLVQKFFSAVAKNGLAVYGLNETKKALEFGQVEMLLLSEDIETRSFRFKCNSCNSEYDEVTESRLRKPSKECTKCRVQAELIKESLLVDDLMEISNRISAKTAFVSTETEEGKQFLDSFSGIGAFLRFK